MTIYTQEQRIAIIKRESGRTIAHKALPIIAIVRVDSPDYVVMAIWCGKGAKPLAHFRYSSEAKALAALGNYWASAELRLAHIAARAEAKRAAKAGIKAADHFTVGDVVYCSWGYDQTNIDFYQVVEVGEKSVKVREVKQKASYNGMTMSGLCQPDRNNFYDDKIHTKIVSEHGTIKMGHSRGVASKWDGRALHYSDGH